MAENLNLFTSTQEVIKEGLDKLGFGEEMYELIERTIENVNCANSSKNG